MPDGKLIEVVSKQAIEDVEKLTKALEDAFGVTAKWEQQLKSVSAPSGLKKGFSDVKNEVTKITKATSDYEKSQRALANAQKQTFQALTNTGKEIEKVRQYKNKINRETRLQVKLESQLFGEYTQLDAALRKVEAKMRDLAVRKEMNNDLSAKEERRLKRLTDLQAKYRGTLDSVDRRMGNWQRNVGNYSSAFDGLGFSIAQLTREAPAFANSMQTGFMAISNNIPMLVDEINKLRTANRALAAEGKPTVSILNRLGSAFFGFQTLISLGIVLLTVYGEKLFTWASQAIGASNAMDKIAENTRKVNEESAKLASQSIAEFTALIAVIKDETAAEDLRYKAKKKLADDYPDFNANILDEKEATEGVTKAIEDYIGTLVQKAKAQAALNLLQEKFTDLLLQQQKSDKLLEESSKITIKNDEDRAKAIERLNTLQERNEQINKKLLPRDRVYNTAKGSLDSYNSSLEKEGQITEEINALLNQYVMNIQDIEISTKNINNERAKEISILGILFEYYDKLQKQISDIHKAQEILGSTSKVTTKDLSDAEGSLAKYIETADKGNKTLTFTNKNLDLIKRQFGGIGTALGLQAPTVENLFDSMVNGFNNAEEAAEQFGALFIDTVGAMAAAENARIQGRIDMLAREKEIALAFAGDSASAREEIEERYDRKVRALKRKQAQANKEANIIQSIINTATAVTKTLAELGFPAGIPAAAVIGSLGAVQTAIIASQRIPEFREGVRDFEGGLAIVGDGGKREPITDHAGNLLGISDDKPTLTYLPKGANVYKDIDDAIKENAINPIGATITRPSELIYQTPQGLTEIGMMRVMKNTLGSMPKQVLNVDKNGVGTYAVKQFNKTVDLNNRVTFEGMNV